MADEWPIVRAVRATSVSAASFLFGLADVHKDAPFGFKGEQEGGTSSVSIGQKPFDEWLRLIQVDEYKVGEIPVLWLIYSIDIRATVSLKESLLKTRKTVCKGIEHFLPMYVF